MKKNIVGKSCYCYILFILYLGRFDLLKYYLHCEDCLSIANPFTVDVLLCSGYWPGNVSTINYMISEDVFVFWDKFQKYMSGSSEKSFLKSLNAISEENGRVST